MIQIPYGRRNAKSATGLELTYTTGNAPTKTLAEWNTFFQTATYALTPFSSFTKAGDVVTLYGATHVRVPQRLWQSSTVLAKFKDYSGEIYQLDEYLFYNDTSFNEIYVPGVITIGNGVFQGTAIADITPLGNATNLGVNAFYGCTSLITADFPNVSTSGDNVFSACSNLVTMNLPKLVKAYGYTGLASFANLQNVILPKTTTIGSYCFYNDPKLNSVILTECTSCGDYAFTSCPLNYIDLSSCTSMGTSIFYGISGRTITLKIKQSMESNANVVSLKSNNTVTVIYSD